MLPRDGRAALGRSVRPRATRRLPERATRRQETPLLVSDPDRIVEGSRALTHIGRSTDGPAPRGEKGSCRACRQSRRHARVSGQLCRELCWSTKPFGTAGIIQPADVGASVSAVAFAPDTRQFARQMACATFSPA